MQTASKSTHKPTHNNAITLLEADHKIVSALFKQYDKAIQATEKKELVSEICKELTIHAQVEEEIFYPQVKQALKDVELIPEARVEHATLKDLIAQVNNVEPDGEDFDAKIKVMSEYVKHHVKEEEDEIFPKAKKTKLDMEKIGMDIINRKAELDKH